MSEGKYDEGGADATGHRDLPAGLNASIDQYGKDEPMAPLDQGLAAFASYNARPARIRQLRREAEKCGLDPNVGFGNAEQIASEGIGRETVTYVSNSCR